jgi:hypothetical protein
MVTTLDRAAPIEATRAAPSVRPALRAHIPALAGQAAAGAGNLVFAVCAAKILGAVDYAHVASFLSLYLLLHVPAAALSAAGALAPDRVTATHRTVLCCGLAVGGVVAVFAQPISANLDLPVALVLALALAAPGAGLLGLARGLAYGLDQQRRLVRSLVTEPIVRIVAGVALTLALGTTGAAIGAVLGGYGALWACTSGFDDRRRSAAATPPRPVDRGATVIVAISFVMVAVVQSIDLIVANRVLDDNGSAQFAVLSTLGGAAVFATATIPMVLMPSITRNRERAAAAAIGLTAAVGLGIAAVATVATSSVVAPVFGRDITPSPEMVGYYLLAMASLGVARALVAHRCATGDGRFAMTAVAVALAADATALLTIATTVRAVATVTLLASTTLALVLSFDRSTRPVVARRTRVQWTNRTGLFAMLALCAVAADLRLATSRGLWVDEAISVHQAQLPFGQMLAQIRYTDVHPPLHHALLWLTVRVAGASEQAVRLPSLVAGVALVPAMAWAGRVIYDKRTGWVAAVLATLAPFCVWYSQEARMYAMFMLFAALALGAQVQAVRRGLRRDWLVYAACTAALIWTQYFAILPVLVQQVAFAWVAWRDRADRPRCRRLMRGWITAMVLVGIALIPLLPILHGELSAYGNRSNGLVPGQAGADSSALSRTISIYAVGANLIWGIWGYHADGVMVQVAALWPVLMLVALVLLGRGRSGPSLLLLALVAVPMAMLFAIGSVKRDLFELRYFSGAVPAMLLLGARLVTATTRRRAAGLVVAGLLSATMAIGLVDQQLNGANPRLYDFKGALADVRRTGVAEPGDSTGRPVLLYEPAYLADVISYYAPDLDIRPLGSPLPPGASTVWVLATEDQLATEDVSAKVGTALAKLERERTLVDTIRHPNVRVWELR